jgi:hypothetical protein
MRPQPDASDARLKLGQAKDHCLKLRRECVAFTEQHFTNEQRENEESQTREWWASCDTAALTPISLTLDDALHQLRSPLDLIFQQLAISNGGDGGNFPMKLDAQGYSDPKLRAKLQRTISSQALTVIDGLKPYKGGNDLLWTLHHSNNQDKHNVLVRAASAAVGAVGRVPMADFTKPTESAPFRLGTMGRAVLLVDVGPITDKPQLIYELPKTDLFAQDVRFTFDIVASHDGNELSLFSGLPDLVSLVEDTVEKLAATFE